MPNGSPVNLQRNRASECKSGAMPPPVAGEVIEFPYPFVHSSHSEYDEDGMSESPCWKPGITMNEEHDAAWADGMGAQIVTVVGTYKPGRFPTRVFFTRQWKDPSGRVFGKGCCRSTTLAAFRSLVRGYRHGFVLDESPLPTRVIRRSDDETNKGLPGEAR